MVMANLTIEQLVEQRRWVHGVAEGIVNSDPDACHDTRLVASVFIGKRISSGKFVRPCIINARDAEIRATQSTALDKRVIKSEILPTDRVFRDGVELGQRALSVACSHAITDHQLGNAAGVPAMPDLPHAVPVLTEEALAC